MIDMGKITIDAVSSYKRVYHPTICEECLLCICDGIIEWCLYYKNRVNVSSKPDFCHVVSIIIEEE